MDHRSAGEDRRRGSMTVAENQEELATRIPVAFGLESKDLVTTPVTFMERELSVSTTLIGARGAQISLLFTIPDSSRGPFELIGVIVGAQSRKRFWGRDTFSQIHIRILTEKTKVLKRYGEVLEKVWDGGAHSEDAINNKLVLTLQLICSGCGWMGIPKKAATTCPGCGSPLGDD